MVIAIIGLVSSVVSAVTAGVKGVQAKGAARTAQFQSAEAFRQTRLLAMRQGSREQMAQTRQAALEAHSQHVALLNKSKGDQRTFLLMGTGAALLGLILISMKKR